ncbi:MAG TPA: hypothetical protein VMN60_00760 [Longimicrobiales bacterium]|nr:hypothetical protein [Longimicrobiales bacterium]
MDARTPFVLLEPVPATLWQRLLRRKPRENAVVEINNRFARAAHVRDVTLSDIYGICQDHRADLSVVGGRLERLYRDYLTHCLTDRQLSAEELADLAHLKAVLRIGDETAARIHDYAARQIYARSVGEVLADGVIDEAEREFLRALQRDLSIPGRVADRIVDAKRRQRTDT